MLEQYLRIKQDHPGALLFYRMGDFYELFFEDAEVAARELSIALTSRNPDAASPVPMCGVPHHAAEGYLAKLLRRGHKVAICDQVEDPRQAKGLVKRAVTRVLTPGTVVEDANLPAKAHNFLAALLFDAEASAGGLAWLDYSTGDWSGLAARDADLLWQWLEKVGPSELLLPEGQEPPRGLGDGRMHLTRLPLRPHFDPAPARDRLLAAQGVADLASLDLADKPQLVRACGALLAYVSQTQMQDVGHLAPFRPLNLSRHLLLDEVTERNLELFRRLDGGRGKGTLWAVLDHTATPMGGRLLAERLKNPWKDLAPIEKTQEAVAFLFEHDGLREALRAELVKVYDLDRLATRIVLGRAMPRDLLALRGSLLALPRIPALFETLPDRLPAALGSLLHGWDGMQDHADRLSRALADSPPPVLTEGGLFKAGWLPELDELMGLTEHGEARVKELLAQEQRDSGLDKLRLGFNKVFGYYFEMSKALADKAPAHFERRQTLVNCERFVTPRLKELEDKLLSASDRRKDLEYKLFVELRQGLAAERHRLADMAERLAALDCWQGLATAARRHGWTRPELHPGLEVRVRGGRHPVVEAVQGAADYIPNDLSLTEDRRILLVTGPNMAGKSTVLRQSALLAILAQIGSYVPADHARLGLVDRIFSRVGASDNLAMGRSTFMVEMAETARILRQATPRSLVILDEIGRGTSTFDGLALAWAVVESLASLGGSGGGREGAGVRTLFATHYHELTALEGQIPGVANVNIAVKEFRGDIVFLRRLIPGPSDRSYGIEVARLAGVPRPVVQRAKEILAGLESKARRARPAEPALREAGQSLLPGMTPPAPAPAGDMPVELLAFLDDLAGLDMDRLPPIEALTFLHRWRSLAATARQTLAQAGVEPVRKAGDTEE
ncbi:MAG: DNA mismatch repair protein MutS [Thermodesulfobacteriota bacterium]